MSRLEVTSEIYDETDFGTTKTSSGSVISKFRFNFPKSRGELLKELEKDKDDDLIVRRKRNECLEIEHQKSTVLDLVGLQVWRGALLLNDFILHNYQQFSNKKVLELGAGTGLTSILASVYCKKVLCTDIKAGGILQLIERNVTLNRQYQRYLNNVTVFELDFMAEKWSPELENELKSVDIVLAADVIYDNDITDVFIQTIFKLFKISTKLENFYVALEKRYVFTVDDLNAVAPMHYYFLENFGKACQSFNNSSSDFKLKLVDVDLDFPQFFEYDKCKELVLMNIVKE